MLGLFGQVEFHAQQGARHALRASGTCYIGHKGHPTLAADADAEYGFDPLDPKTLGKVIDRCPSSSDLGIGIDHTKLDLTKSPNWGAYNSAHVYPIDFAGKGAPFSLNYHDCALSDNNGSLKVEIFCPPTKQ